MGNLARTLRRRNRRLNGHQSRPPCPRCKLVKGDRRSAMRRHGNRWRCTACGWELPAIDNRHPTL